MKINKKFKLYSDAGHGWMAVKRELLIQLGIYNQITTYSYQRGSTVYLEEDCDLTTFVNAVKSLGLGYEFMFGTNSSLLESAPEDKLIRIDSKHCERSPIRSYDSFSSI